VKNIEKHLLRKAFYGLYKIERGLQYIVKKINRNQLSEQVLTCIADHSIALSILYRDYDFYAIRHLRSTLLSILHHPLLLKLMLKPGPESWAVYASLILSDPVYFHKLVHRYSGYQEAFEKSALLVSQINPCWRPLEINYILNCLMAKDEYNNNFNYFSTQLLTENNDAYTLTHITFYLSCFGKKNINSDIKNVLITLLDSRFLNLSGIKNNFHIDVDIEVEIIIALHYLNRKWPVRFEQWIDSRLMPWVEAAGMYASNDSFMKNYHPLLMSVILLITASQNFTNKERGDLDEPW